MAGAHALATRLPCIRDSNPGVPCPRFGDAEKTVLLRCDDLEGRPNARQERSGSPLGYVLSRIRIPGLLRNRNPGVGSSPARTHVHDRSDRRKPACFLSHSLPPERTQEIPVRRAPPSPEGHNSSKPEGLAGGLEPSAPPIEKRRFRAAQAGGVLTELGPLRWSA